MHKSLLFLALIVFSISCARKHEDPVKLNDHPTDMELFAEGFISTHLNERDLAIAPSGNEIIYTLGNYDQTIRCLVQIKREKDGWGDKTILKISGTYNDIEPFFSPDGQQLFFASDRPLPGKSEKGDYNIWVSKIEDASWSEPLALDSIINTEGDEFYPSVTDNGNLYFTATRANGIGSEDIFKSVFKDGIFLKPEPLDTMINSGTYEFNAYVSPDENLIIYSSFGRSDGMGGGDLYYSKKDQQGNWQKAKNMGTKINSTKLDYCPFIDFSNNNFYFTSNRTVAHTENIKNVQQLNKQSLSALNGMGNIYRVKLDQLNL